MSDKPVLARPREGNDSRTDSLRLSAKATETLALARRIVEHEESAHAARLDHIRELVQSGRYEVSSEAIAEAMLSSVPR